MQDTGQGIAPELRERILLAGLGYEPVGFTSPAAALQALRAQQMVQEQGRPLAISDGFMRDLLGRTWRGNARELRSHLEQAVVMSEAGVLDADAGAPSMETGPGEDEQSFPPLHAMVEAAERRHILRALDRSERSIARTAELLGISRKTLWEKMKRLGLSA